MSILSLGLKTEKIKPNVLFIPADDFGNQDMSCTGRNPQLVRQLHQELFDCLKRVGARFPVADPLYSEHAERRYLEGI